MQFRYTADEVAILEEAARTFRKAFPVERLGRGEPSTAGWAEAGRAGWLHAGLDEAHGGSGLPLYMVAGLAREAGRQLAVEGFVNNAVVLPRLLRFATDGGAALARQTERPGFLLVDGRGERLFEDPAPVVPWVFGVEGGMDPWRLERMGSEFRLTRWGEGAVRSRPVGDLALDVADVEIVGEPVATVRLEASAHDVERIAAEAAVVQAAALVGVGEAAVRETVAYLGIRQQFGRPVGQFQALKHLLADAHARLEVAFHAVLHAALETEPLRLAVARAQAGQAAFSATKLMIQLHGGIGYTWDHPAHYYLKTAMYGAMRFGGVDRQVQRLGEALVRAVAP
ncbi:MAG: acyl-CoA/acyl-ACP dehydrogenase [Actinomycetia bacterium]|nr:acyl-CoA/acyl-ACP dehydrogenase [Actinomycetes bacterium]